jgi:hypothetical protein
MHLGQFDIALRLQPLEYRRPGPGLASITAVTLSGNTRGTLPVMPPPVMCAMPLTVISFISASSGLT